MSQEIAAPSFEQGEEAYSPLMNKYQEAISITEHYRETKSRFTWIGEIEDERLLSALENLSDADLNLVTMYAYEGYTVTEISKVLGVAQPTISIKIKSSFENAGSVEDMMLYTELEAAVHAMIQRLEYSFTFNPSLLTIPKRKQQVAEILKEAETYIWRIKEEMRCA